MFTTRLLHKIHDAKILSYPIVTWHRKILSVVRYWQIHPRRIRYSFRRSLLESRAFWRIIPTWQSRQERRRLKYVESTWRRRRVIPKTRRCTGACVDVRKTPCGHSCKPRNVVRKSDHVLSRQWQYAGYKFFPTRLTFRSSRLIGEKLSSFHIGNFGTILIDKLIVSYMQYKTWVYY